MNSGEEPLQERIRQALDARVEGLDGATRARLAQARGRALTGRHSLRDRLAWRPGALPLAAAATLAALAVTVLLVMPQSHDPAPALYVVDAAILDLADADADADLDLELVGELDFYDWLALAEIEDDPS